MMKPFLQPAQIIARLALICLLASIEGCHPAAPPGSAAPTPPATAAPSIQFTEVAEAAGVHYAWQAPGKAPHNILDTIGNGCAFLDFDGDGALDVLLVGPKPALYRGDGKGRFTEVTQQMGLGGLSGHFLGCAVGDYDNDGFPDIYLSAYQGGVLLHNEAGKGYKDATRPAGLAAQPWGTSCAWVDVDGDGRLDLFICNYAIFGPKTEPQMCSSGATRIACGPRYYQPEKNILYRNAGNGKFQNVTTAWNITSTQGKGLGVTAADYDDSGHQSLAIANDEVPGDLLHFTKGRFENVGKTAGVGYDNAGQVHGGMGIDWGDYDNDGKLDLFVATFATEPKSIYHNEGSGYFTDTAGPLGIGLKTKAYVTFGGKFLDADNDGWLDLMLANGHIEDNVAVASPGETYPQPLQLFHNQNGTALEEITATAGPGLQHSIVGRGLAIGDYDNDGRMDALAVDAEGKCLLLHNETANPGHWLSCRLIGTKCNRDGFGALVTVKTGRLSLLRRCGTDGSYLSASEARLHFGLGANTAAQTLTVKWPDGHTDTYANLPADHFITIQEGASKPL